MKKNMVNKHFFKKIVAGLLVSAMLTGLCACGKKKTDTPVLDTNFSERVNTFSFSAQPSELLTFSAESVQAVTDALAQIKPEYAYIDMYELDEVKKRLVFDASVQKHQFSALNENGILTAANLCQLVLINNEAYLEQNDFGCESLDDNDYIMQLCEFIVNIVTIMQQKYPDIDWQRVYCNLGNLKILYKPGMLSYAEVSSEMVLSLSKYNSTTLLNMQGEHGFADVLTHEIMHLIQIGCACENIENCSRRAGIALYWDDFSKNTADWTWLVEGSAERHMCAVTGHDAITYQYKMDYLCSMTASVLLRDSVKADTMETLCFQNDPQLLFDAFGCETEAERDEVLKMMITLQILQMQPNVFLTEYKEKTGIDLNEDEEAMNQFCYSLKPPVCIALAKEFYENLIVFLQENQVTYNDLFFLINLFEGHLNQHLRYANTANAEINQPFFTAYNAMRSALFDALSQDNPGQNINAMYADYVITVDDKTLNAKLDMLPSEKQDFLAERAQWQAELLALGQKAPQ